MPKDKNLILSFAKQNHAYLFLIRFALANSIIFYLIGLRYLFITLSSDSYFTTSFYQYTTLFGKALVLCFTFATYLGHFSLLAYLPCLIMLPICFISYRKKTVISFAVFLWSCCAIILFVDSIFFSLFHFHLNTTLLSMLIDPNYGLIQFAEPSFHELTIGLTIGLGIILIESCLALILWHYQNKRFAYFIKRILIFLLCCLIFSYSALVLTIVKYNNVLAMQTPNFPLYNQILAKLLPVKNSFALLSRFSETRFSQPLFPTKKLNYPLHPLSCTSQDKPYNIVLIVVDTLRADAFNPVLMPNLTQFAKQSWDFKQHFSGGNSTQAGLFSLFYGLPSNYWSSMLKAGQGALFIQNLLEQNYDIRIMFSSNMVPPFHKTIFKALHHLRTQQAPGDTIPDRDRYITQEFINFIDTRKPNQVFFSFLLYDAVHSYFSKQNFPMLYPVSTKDGVRVSLLQTKEDEIETVKRYQNAVHFVDSEINKILTALKNKNLFDNTIIIITSDHGEEFNDNHDDYWGHGSNYTSAQTQVPLIIYWPKQSAKTWMHLTSHYDITPFLMKNALNCHNAIDDYSIGEPLLSHHQKKYLLIGSYTNMCIVEKDKNTTLMTTGHIQISDQHAKPLPYAKANHNLLSEALLTMRKYYQ